MATSILAFAGNVSGVMAMVSPLFVWSAIVIVLAALIILCISVEVWRHMGKHRSHSIKNSFGRHFRNLVQIGSEREEMYVPGDPFPWEH